MKNTKNITKYLNILKIISIVMVFVVALPVAVLADDDGGDISYYDNNPDISYYDNNPDISSNNPNISYYDNSNGTVTSGSYSNSGNYGSYGYGSGNYSYSPSSTVTSGSFAAGTNNGTAAVDYVEPTSNVTTGGFIAQTNNGTAAVYYYPPTSTVTSGGYSAGTATYYYYNQSNPVISNQVLAYTNTNPIVDSTYLSGDQTVPNQVSAYTNTNSNLSSVYLSSVPNTGFEDYYGTILFILMLILWSAILAYIFLKRKVESKKVFAVADAAETNITNNSVNSDLMNQIVSDNSDISKVEEYARIKKVLLSSDAVGKIIKLSRFGKINASDFIRSVSTGEWIAVGENQIK
jgi:hypothetical protein